MTLNKSIISVIENGDINFLQFESAQPLQPNLKKSLAAVRQFKSLFLKYDKRPNTPEEWLEFIEWAVKFKILSQQSKTWRITKSRLKNIFEHPLFIKKIEETEKRIRSDYSLDDIDTLGTNASKKAKYMPEQISNALIRFLKSSKSENADAAIRWIKVSLITGMRGIEWSKTEFHENNGQPYLRIVNSTKGSPLSTRVKSYFAPIRNFPLSHVTTEDIDTIKAHLNHIRDIIDSSGLKGFNNHYEVISNLIYLQNRKLPDEARANGTYGIYSCRHQLIANLKASKRFTTDQIGRMVGQSTRRVTERAYAKAKAGYITSIPLIDDDIDD